MTNELESLMEGSGSGLILGFYPADFMEVSRKATKTLSRIACVWAGLNPRPPEYDAGTLTTRPRQQEGHYYSTDNI
jgi:hypothetical protein